MCDACLRVEAEPSSGLTLTGCYGCAPREIARSPLYFQCRQEGVWLESYRELLCTAFDPKLTATSDERHAEVRRWALRLGTHARTAPGACSRSGNRRDPRRVDPLDEKAPLMLLGNAPGRSPRAGPARAG